MANHHGQAEMSNTGPHSVRDAAVKILLGDMAPIVEKLDQATAEISTFQQNQRLIQAEFDGDMGKLGESVKAVFDHHGRLEVAAKALAAAADRLETASKRFDASPRRSAPSVKAVASSSKPGAGTFVLALLLVIALAGCGFLGWKLQDQRRASAYGHATLKAWPALDEKARRTIEANGR